jgi:hypothetical protein
MVTTPVLTTKVDPVETREDDYDYDANVLAPDVFDEIPEGMEFVDGLLVEKPEVTILHSAQVLGFTANQTIATQRVLPGFAIDLSALFT